jgi:hypothetical protein
MEHYFNAKGKKFSEVYFKIKNLKIFKKPLLVKRSSLPSANSLIILDEKMNNLTNEIGDALLFKVRSIFFRKGLPVYKDQVASILQRSWLSKLNKTAFDSQNGLRILVQIHEISTYMTNKDEEVFGFKYTVAINGQDPKFLGVQEPTFEDYLLETKSQNLTFLEFCPCNTFKINRFYVHNENADENLSAKINDILSDVWKDSNSLLKRKELNNKNSLGKNRITGRSKLDHGFYDSNLNSVSRFAITWLVDGADPNEIFFNSPKFENILSHVKKSNFNVFTQIPYVKQSIEITSFNSSYKNLLKKSIQIAWHLANPNMDDQLFDIIFENFEDMFRFRNESTQSVNKRNIEKLKIASNLKENKE